MRQWLETLPKLVGILAANDDRAASILETCRVLGYGVPENRKCQRGVDGRPLFGVQSDGPGETGQHRGGLLLVPPPPGFRRVGQRLVEPEGVGVGAVAADSSVVPPEPPSRLRWFIRAVLVDGVDHGREVVLPSLIGDAFADPRIKIAMWCLPAGQNPADRDLWRAPPLASLKRLLYLGTDSNFPVHRAKDIVAIPHGMPGGLSEGFELIPCSRRQASKCAWLRGQWSPTTPWRVQ